MAVYGHESSHIEGHVIQEEFENIKNDELILPCKENDYVEASLNAIMDIEENYSALTTNIALHEANYLNEHEDFYFYTEANITDFVHAIKRFLLRIWDKIVAIYKHFIMTLDRFTLSDKAFVNKYRKQIFDGKSLKDFSFFGYEYTINENEIKAAIDELAKPPQIGSINLDDKTAGTGNLSSDDISKANVQINEMMETLRGKVLEKFSSGGGKAGKYSSGDFLKELFQALRKGADSKDELDNTKLNVQDMCNELMTAADAKKKAKAAFKEGKKVIDAGIKQVESKQNEGWREVVKDPTKIANTGKKQGPNGTDKTNQQVHDDKMKEMGFYLNYHRQSKAMLITVEGAVLNALRDRSKQYKLCLVKIINHEEKKE